MAADKGGPLNVIANLPYYIVSQVLFSLADSHRAVDTAVLTMQLEVNFKSIETNIISALLSFLFSCPSSVVTLFHLILILALAHSFRVYSFVAFLSSFTT